MYNIGIDLGGTNIAGGIMKDKQLLNTLSVPTNAGRAASEIIKDIAMLCRELINTAGINEVDCVGIGTPGIVDTKNGVVHNAVNVCSQSIDFRSSLAEYINVPVYVENDANCAAVGEAVCGASAGYKNSVMITLGTGIGGGIIIDGHLFSGIKGGGGEIGHMVICADSSEKCNCGRMGCFEQYASAAALVHMMERAAQYDSTLTSPFDGKMIFSLAKQGNKTALGVIEQFKHYLSVGIANIINIFEPDIVVVGGGMSAQGEYLMEPVRKMVYESILSKTSDITKICAARLGNDAGIIGAAFCANFR